jgi:ankyrin repeat protein
MHLPKVAVSLGITLLGMFRVQGADDSPLPTDHPEAVALYQASAQGDLSQVKKLVEGGAPIDGKIGKYLFTPLIGAADGNHPEVVDYLISRLANVDVPDSQGSTPLLHACWTNHTDCALALIDGGAHVNSGSSAGRTPLMYASMHGNDKIVTDLIAHRVRLNDNCTEGPALHWAASGNHLTTVKLLCAAGADPNLLPSGNGSPLYSVLGCAASNGNLDMIDYLLGLGQDVNGPGTDGSTPLMAATDYGRIDAMGHLLGKGAQIDLKDKKGETALMRACEAGKMASIHALVERKADLDATDPRGETALTIAGDTGQMEVVDYLKTQGAQRTEVHIIARQDPPQPLSPDHAWALAVGAIYAQRFNGNTKVLGEGYAAEDSQTMLSRDWKIRDKGGLFQELDDLRDHGHHSTYQAEGAALALMSDGQFNKLLASQPDQAVAIKATRASYIKWKERSGLAWDLCRAANLVSNAFSAHYINEQEAWERLMEIARLAQSHFGSWREMSDNFLDGREIWADQRDARFEACAQLLLNPKDPNSPWNQNSWKTELPAQ